MWEGLEIAGEEQLLLPLGDVLRSEKHDLFEVSPLFPLETEGFSGPFIVDQSEAIMVIFR
ncbi:MAG TPA: hypothetical protein DC022_05035 [Alcanivorax sp.]|nr:hypothetical protein [Alcanivorax sp.]